MLQSVLTVPAPPTFVPQRRNGPETRLRQWCSSRHPRTHRFREFQLPYCTQVSPFVPTGTPLLSEDFTADATNRLALYAHTQRSLLRITAAAGTLAGAYPLPSPQPLLRLTMKEVHVTQRSSILTRRCIRLAPTVIFPTAASPVSLAVFSPNVHRLRLG